uniref:Uncharacterized protein n=1 Tax=Onchocerca volvulus TaxID=6282 RepID=A0A8R1XLD6_ONCVO
MHIIMLCRRATTYLFTFDSTEHIGQNNPIKNSQIFHSFQSKQQLNNKNSKMIGIGTTSYHRECFKTFISV